MKEILVCPKHKTIGSQPYLTKDKVKKSEIQEDLLSCNKCDYKAKKEANLKKHMISQHECKENLPSFMDLLKHVAKHHDKETIEVKDVEQAGITDIQNENINEEEQVEKDKSFVFSESKLDQFIL